ncbi:MAG: aminotransferase class III-fold pyridoxal phosphate-dependent enzyme [Candidatus Thorarchaeota archaeon]
MPNLSSKDQNRPQFADTDAQRIALELFGIEGSISELPSERDRNFYFKKGPDEYVLKIAATSEVKENLEFQNSAMAHLASKSTAVPCPQVMLSKSGHEILSAEDSEGNSHFVRMLTYLPGKVLAKVNPHSPELLEELGSFMGQLSSSLADFSHPATHRQFYWDLKNAESAINQYKERIQDERKSSIVEYFLQEFKSNVIPQLPNLRTSVLQNDGNDYNIIVNESQYTKSRTFGIIDFGDMVYSNTIFELAIVTAYTILEKSDPIAAAAQIIRGYHREFPLTELEIELLFYMICIRLTMTVTIAAYQTSLEPDNEYLRISEAQAWDTLFLLREVHPRFAAYTFRDACDLVPCPNSQSTLEWLSQNQSQIGSIVDFDLRGIPTVVLDLSVGSPEIGSLMDLTDPQRFTKLVNDRIEEAQAEIGIGRYAEPRLIYSDDRYRASLNEGSETRTIHIAIDLFMKFGTPVFAPMDGRIHSFQNNPGPLDNGPTIVIEHAVNEELTFYTLYAHLTDDSLEGLSVGQSINKGERIASVGKNPQNGGWPSHLHFQLIADMMGWKGDFYGVALPSQRRIWRSISPNPNSILVIPEDVLHDDLSTLEILQTRADVIGQSLSISYEDHLNIVRGYMQFLYDETGQAYLDAVNNVPHVGHSHPRVVRALHQQASVLNTNTRYLHRNLVEYARKLSSKMPESLSVCFFVNSGSEANELALRLAQAHTNQQDMIAIDGAYHGNTSQLVGLSSYKHDGPGGKGTPSHVHVVKTPDTFRGEYRVDDSEAGSKYAAEVLDKIDLVTAAGRGIAGFLFEPLMGCAGQIIFPRNYLQEAFRHVRKAGGVCISDEVQVGFGRVGTHFWGFETQDVVPDIVTMGKPIGNGHPLGAVVTTPEIANSFNNGMEFFSTTGGNTVSCAVGLAVLDVIEKENLQQNALEVGKYLLDRLETLKQKYKLIGDVRGLGLFIGVELVRNRETLEPADREAKYIINRMKAQRILISVDGPLRNVLKIKPPLVFTKENADFLVDTLDEILSEDFVFLAVS